MVDVPDKNAPFRAAIDSTIMITIARFGMPLAIAILGWFVTTTLNDIKTGQRDGLAELKTGQMQVWVQMGKLNEGQTTNSIALGSLESKVDGGLKQIDHLQMQVDGLQKTTTGAR